jgi:hypothetical protein
MSGKTQALAEQYLRHLFNGERPPWDSADRLWMSLHSADPQAQGDQLAHEIDYPGYQRSEIARAAAAFTIAKGESQNLATVIFPECGVTGRTFTATHGGIGLSRSGGGVLLYSYALAQPLVISANISPYYKPGDAIAREG